MNSEHSIAIGYGAEATGANAIAIGTNVKATVPNSVLLGGPGSIVSVDTLKAERIECESITFTEASGPVATCRFPHPMVVNGGDSVQCTFTINTDIGTNFFIKEAILYGVAETQRSHAERLAHLVDSLAHFAAGLPKPTGECDPSIHLERAIRELAHAMLALDQEEG